MYFNELEVARHYYQVEVKVSIEHLYILLNGTILLQIFLHSMRKTFGYHFYQQTKDVPMLQQIGQQVQYTLNKRASIYNKVNT
ncbi:hypothetical protein [Peribacillus loiseleuriae]|uniref:hypothetical protein n=1 Tax=Peribacillus loiseleuriae TaxID=1679170 RepID=UPI003D0709BB